MKIEIGPLSTELEELGVQLGCTPTALTRIGVRGLVLHLQGSAPYGKCPAGAHTLHSQGTKRDSTSTSTCTGSSPSLSPPGERERSPSTQSNLRTTPGGGPRVLTPEERTELGALLKSGELVGRQTGIVETVLGYGKAIGKQVGVIEDLLAHGVNRDVKPENPKESKLDREVRETQEKIARLRAERGR